MEEFFKEMTTPTPFHEKNLYTNEELKLINWRVDKYDGQWCDGLIPKFSTFNFHGRQWEVKISGFLFMGWGLFAMDPAKAGDILLSFVGPQYTRSEYRRMISLVPRFKSYVLKAEDDIYIDGRVERGNVAGFINSSIGREEIGNVVWEYSLAPKPWNKDEWGFVMTIASRDIEVGEELFAYYSVN
jgi:hypothetical protein